MEVKHININWSFIYELTYRHLPLFAHWKHFRVHFCLFYYAAAQLAPEADIGVFEVYVFF